MVSQPICRSPFNQMKSAGYRLLIYKEYLIFYSYEHKENTVYILAVFKAKRDYMKVVKKFI